MYAKYMICGFDIICLYIRLRAREFNSWFLETTIKCLKTKTASLHDSIN